MKRRDFLAGIPTGYSLMMVAGGDAALADDRPARPDFDRIATPENLMHMAREEEAEIVIQVNGKVRGHVYVAFGTPREALEKHAMGDAKIRSLLDGKQVVKVIVVPDKLVNIVVK